MSEAELSSLVRLGLTLLQAKVYVALLRKGTSRAIQLCTATELARPEIYRILRELSDRDLARRNLSTPTTYTATPPEKALSSLVQQVKDRLSNMELEKMHLIRTLSPLAAPSEASSDYRLTLIDGSDNVDRLERQLIAEAKEEYVAVMSKHGLDQNTTNALLSAYRRKLRIRVIAEIDDSNAKFASRLSRHLEIRRSKDILFYVNIFDRKQMLFGPAFIPTDRQHNIRRELDLWTSNPRFVNGMYAMFEKLWEVSSKYTRPNRINKNAHD